MLRISLIIIVLAVSVTHGQFNEINKIKLSDKNSFSVLKQSKEDRVFNRSFDSTKPVDVKPEYRSKKSPGLAMIYSLIIPGMGQLYTNRFDVGKYFMISEAALWFGYASFTVYGNWLLNDSYNYSVSHAGVTKGDKAKEDDFWINISNYNNVEDYNNDMLERGSYDKVYFPNTGFDFHWESEASRKLYREDKLAGDRIRNDRLFIVGAVVLNHIISAISAIIVTNSYNKGGQTSGGVVINAEVVKHFNKVDGIKLNLTKWF